MFGPQGRLGIRDSGEWLFTHQDVLGSTVALTDTTGGIVSQFDYDGYGNTTVRVNYQPTSSELPLHHLFRRSAHQPLQAAPM